MCWRLKQIDRKRKKILMCKETNMSIKLLHAKFQIYIYRESPYTQANGGASVDRVQSTQVEKNQEEKKLIIVNTTKGGGDVYNYM